MLKKFITTLKRHSLLLSLLLHLLFLSSVVLVWLHPPIKIEKSPDLYIPSYIYKPTPAPEEDSQASEVKQKSFMRDKAYAKEGLQTSPDSFTQNAESKQSELQPNQAKYFTDEDPVHLIGDKNKVAEPLIKLIGKAIYKHLTFPKMAWDFNIRGISSIGFVVHPDGNISDISLLKSSGTEVLDNEALKAIGKISPLVNVNKYVSEPTYLVANIIFR